MQSRIGVGSQEGAPRPLVYLLFFLTGATGLVYEVSWSRQVGVVVGHTAEATALVLASYFAGLAVGQFLSGGIARKVNPLLGYGAAETGAGLLACFVPALLSGVGEMSSGFSGDDVGGTAVRSLWCFLILLLPTIPLGATFPFVAEYFIRRNHGARRHVPFAYAVNTAGGILGVIAATAFLLVAVGVRRSGEVAALVSMACGVVATTAALLCRNFRVREPQPTSADTVVGTAGWRWRTVAAVSGFGTLGTEVLYTRLFALVFHNSSYTFGAVLAVFLLGLALGAGLVATAFRRAPRERLVILAFSVGGLLLPASLLAFYGLTGFRYFDGGETFTSYMAGAFGLVALVVLPPVTVLGMALPLAIAGSGSCARTAGRLVSINTSASILGALAAGFLLPERFGLWGTFGFFSLLFAATGTFLLAGTRLYLAGSVVILTLVVACFAITHTRERASAMSDREEVVRRWESPYGWVDVVRDNRTDAMKLRQNLHYRHGSTANATREYRQGRLPLLLHPHPSDVAFLGLGTGMTAAPVARDDRVRSATLVELIPEVIEAARLFSGPNLGVLDDPKVDVRVADARRFVAGAGPKFDVIVSDLFVPWESRSGYLYTVDFYRAVRGRLKPQGLFCQWLALYQLGPAEFEIIADSFAAAFPHATLWWGQMDARFPMVAIVGAETPLDARAESLEARLAAAGVMPGGFDPDLSQPDDLPALFVGRWPPRLEKQVNTDEHPRLEFRAPLSHRAGLLLRGPFLRAYFDTVLSTLPSDGVEFGALPGAAGSDAARRTAQRVSLFGDTER